MHLQIKSVILWPRDPSVAPRVLPFQEGRVNVITGASKTGKSAVIPIVDYCLGADRCAIPVATIRDSVSWFGVLLSVADGELLLARREPGDQQSTGDMFMAEGPSIVVPERTPTKNTTVDSVKATLNERAGLSNLGFDPSADVSSFRGRPSFRDMVAFCFQPQNIIANPNVLLFKADTSEHREKLRTIMPYVLGAVTPETLAARWEVDQLQRSIARAERERQMRTQATARWVASLQSWLSEARAFGLLTPDQVAAANTEALMVDLMSLVADARSDQATVEESTLEADRSELRQLEKEESSAALEYSEVSARVDQMAQLRASVEEFSVATSKQRERLGLARWLRRAHDATRRCPLCEGDFGDHGAQLNALCDALSELEATGRQLSPVPATFDREMAAARAAAGRIAERLKAVRQRRLAIETRSDVSRRARLRRDDIERFIGRVQQALQVYRQPADADGVADLERMRLRLREKLREISEDDINRRISAALREVSGNMGRIIPSLDTQNPKAPAEFDTRDLTVRVTGRTGRADYLFEIGSGAQHLSYHVAALLALHELFLDHRRSPVPALLVVDQPSQVYFPRRVSQDREGEADDPRLRDEDVAAVRKVFEALNQAVVAAKGALQVVVMDHAGADAWGGFSHVTLVEEWRGGRKLVPHEWTSAT